MRLYSFILFWFSSKTGSTSWNHEPQLQFLINVLVNAPQQQSGVSFQSFLWSVWLSFDRTLNSLYKFPFEPFYVATFSFLLRWPLWTATSSFRKDKRQRRKKTRRGGKSQMLHMNDKDETFDPNHMERLTLGTVRKQHRRVAVCVCGCKNTLLQTDSHHACESFQVVSGMLKHSWAGTARRPTQVTGTIPRRAEELSSADVRIHLKFMRTSANI